MKRRSMLFIVGTSVVGGCSKDSNGSPTATNGNDREEDNGRNSSEDEENDVGITETEERYFNRVLLIYTEGKEDVDTIKSDHESIDDVEAIQRLFARAQSEHEKRGLEDGELFSMVVSEEDEQELTRASDKMPSKWGEHGELLFLVEFGYVLESSERSPSG
jgi:hypothetical protein